MTYAEIASMIASAGFPTAYYQFPDGTGQAPPFICFFYPESRDMYADDSNYQKVEHLVVELYTDNKDFAAEAAVEAALRGAGMTWTRSEAWLDSERMQEVIYETDVVITEE
ncbi:MAG: hypothetical protein IKF99_03225 [Oscillospiraceae bacterium]|nr:hypothetical protein [Oscillospiraceae bacterium]